MSDIHIPHKKEEDPVLTNALRAMFAMVILVLIAVTAFQFSGMQKSAIPPKAKIIAEAQISISTDQTGAVQVFNAHGEMLADWDGDKGGFVSGVARVIPSPISTTVGPERRLAPVSRSSTQIISCGAWGISPAQPPRVRRTSLVASRPLELASRAFAPTPWTAQTCAGHCATRSPACPSACAA